MANRLLARSLLSLGMSAALVATAAAHHGWSWADSEQITLTGKVAKVQIAPPHPWMDVQTDDGTWRVELGNPSQTERSGFAQGSAKPGDEITAVGNRARDHDEKRLKAVQISVGGKTYDIYPERILKK